MTSPAPPVGGLCAQVDPELFFLERDESPKPAKLVCARCPVLAACRAWGIEHERYGVWGGTTELERKRLRRRSA